MGQPVYPARGHIDPGIKTPFPSARRPTARTPEFRERLASVRHRMQFEACRFLRRYVDTAARKRNELRAVGGGDLRAGAPV